MTANQSDADETPLSVLTRFWFAWVCFFRVLFDGEFARRCFRAQSGPDYEALPPPKGEAKASPREERERKQLTQADADSPRKADAKKDEVVLDASSQKPATAVTTPDPKLLHEARNEGALMLLGLLQSEGRLVDFLQQDITGFDDADIGTAARVIHEGCNKALKGRVAVSPIRSETEGSTLSLDGDYDAASVKLIGNLGASKSPVKGTLRHKGWRATSAKFPEPAKGHVATVICPAEVEV